MRKLLLFQLLILLPALALAGITGKIRGRITEVATGDPLPYGQVMIVGTGMGAVADLDGFYYILNIPPGTYSVRAMMMGYHTLTKENVKVTMDQTEEVDFAFTLKTIDLQDTLEVVATKIIEADVTCSKKTLTRETIEAMPIRTFQEAIASGTGVVVDPNMGEIHMRGGRGGEVLYMVDGLAIRDVLVGGGFGMRMGNNAIEELAMIAGGFNAEYGQAQSGVVNLITREGGSSYTGSINYSTDDLGKRLEEFSFNTDRLDASLSGPIPVIPTTFFISGTGEWTDSYIPFDIERPRRLFTEIPNKDIYLGNRQLNYYTGNSKFVTKFSPTKRLTFGYRASAATRQNYRHIFKRVPENSYLRKESDYQVSMGWNHTLTSKTFYEIKLAKFMTSYMYNPGGKTPDFFKNNTAIPPRGNTDEDGFYTHFDQWRVWHTDSTHIWTAKFDVTSQVTRQHLVKTGLELNYLEISQQEIQYPQEEYNGAMPVPEGQAYPDQGVFRDFFYRTPSGGAVYLQDKIETEGMIVNAGIRFDFWYPGKQVEVFVDPVLLDTIRTTFKYQLSPRLGISYPITAMTKLYFYYGLFAQVPELQYLYQSSTQGATAAGYYGNPNLDAERTTAYEVGVEHALGRNYKVGVTGYFKDMRGLIDMEKRGKEPLEGHIFENMDYADVRGVELHLDKGYSRYTSFRGSYTLQWAYGKSSSDRQNYDYDFNNQPIPIRSFPLEWDQRHAIQANLDFRVPAGQHPLLFGLRLPDRWGVNILWQHSSGLPYTPTDREGNALPGETTNSARKPATDVLDLKANKDFSMGFLEYSFILEIKNLFNRKNVRKVHADTGTPEGDWREIELDPTNWGPGRNVFFGVALSW